MFDQFREIVLCDFEFGSDAGDRPNPVCLVAFELRSGRKHRLWRDEFGPLPPYPTGPDILFTAYYASAEIGCHLALGWPAPARVLDLFTEFRCITNGSPLIAGRGLIGALAHHGLDTISITEKTEMRELAIELGRTGRPATSDERTALLTYCEGDTAALERLLPVMAPQIDLPRALLRGRYMAAVARIEANGVPVDVEMLDRLQRRWDGIQDHLIAELDCEYGVYDGRSFRTDWFEQLLARLDVPWPRLESGRLNLQDKTFRAMATAYPVLNTLRELRASLSSMRLKDIAVGRDGRHRTLLSAFRATSGRNQPSNVNDPRGGKKSVFVFGPATWVRGLIKPPPGFGISYIDYEQQEFGIAAAMSGDPAMLAAYQSGDPYLAFARQAGAVPSGATKETHGAIRELYKQCVLGIQYGMGEHSLALRIGGPPALARKLLNDHKRVYRRFWEWIERTVNNALLFNRTRTVFGWQINIGEDFNPRSLQNFPMQSHGSEMLHLACCLAGERDIEVCAPVHDAVLICAPLDRLDDDIVRARAAMAEASRAVLAGFELRTEATTVRWPDRFMDEKRGRKMWDVVVRLARELKDGKAVA